MPYIKKTLKYIRWRLWDAWHFYAGIKGAILTKQRFNSRPVQQPHSLPAPLVLSLTSYPPRFKDLELTIKSLLTQSIRPDHVVLWIAGKDIHCLPDGVRGLTARGLEIYTTDDTGPYKKLVPALARFPDAFIVTADDDVFYSPDWLRSLIAEWDGSDKHVLGHQGYYATFEPDGSMTPNRQWKAHDTPERETWFMPVGESGIFYPPRIMHPDVSKEDIFQELAPRADDFWFYWMARLNGARYTEVKTEWQKVNWPRSQHVGLFMRPNNYTDHDVKLKRLLDRYGWVK